MVDQLNRLRQCQQRLGQQLGRDPSLAELAEATGLNPLDIREVLFRAQEPLSLDAQSGSGSEQKLMETLACRTSNPQDQLAITLMQQDIARVFQDLPRLSTVTAVFSSPAFIVFPCTLPHHGQASICCGFPRRSPLHHPASRRVSR